MSDFRLQTEINDSNRRDIDLHLEKRKIELEIESQNAEIGQRIEKSLTVWGIIVLTYALAHFILGGPFDYIFFSIMGIGTLIEFIWLFIILRRKKQRLEDWDENPRKLIEPDES